jgi:hypothetical protein
MRRFLMVAPPAAAACASGKRIVEEFAVDFPSPDRMTVSSIEPAAEDRSTLELVGTKETAAR